MAKGDWNKRTHDEIKNIVNDLGYFLLEEYSNSKYQKKVIIRDEWGYKYDIFLVHLMDSNRKLRIVDLSRSEISIENICIWLKLENKPFELCHNNKYRGNDEPLWFHCLIAECNEIFESNWSHISFRGQGCPYCSGHRLSNKNRLSTSFEHISDEWDYELNKDTPNDVFYGSGEKRWWICPKGHKSYFMTINNRTSGHGSSCPICGKEFIESKVAFELKKWCLNTFINVQTEYKCFRNEKTNSWLWYDIYIGKQETFNGIYIEIHGGQHYKYVSFWHRTKERFYEQMKRDNAKKKFAQENGTYIEIDLRKITSTEHAIEYVKDIVNTL